MLAHYCFQKYGILPMDFYRLDIRSKAFIAASAEAFAEEVKKAEK